MSHVRPARRAQQGDSLICRRTVRMGLFMCLLAAMYSWSPLALSLVTEASTRLADTLRLLPPTTLHYRGKGTTTTKGPSLTISTSKPHHLNRVVGFH